MSTTGAENSCGKLFFKLFETSTMIHSIKCLASSQKATEDPKAIVNVVRDNHFHEFHEEVHRVVDNPGWKPNFR